VIAFGRAPALDVVSATPHAVVVRVTTLTDDPVDLILADMNGHNLLPARILVRPGVHDVRIDVGDLAGGAYIVQMRHGLFTGSTKFILTR